jgi:hypothetical protein
MFALALLCVASPILLADYPQPYAGLEQREIKSLSDDEIRAYLEGDGMGYALVAELNRYPGPRHVLDLAVGLELSEAQLELTRAIHEAMREEATRLGRQVVAAEAELDRLFAMQEINEQALRSQLRHLADLQAELRGAHLSAHLRMRELLQPGQIQRYDHLRGYSGGHEHRHHRHH